MLTKYCILPVVLPLLIAAIGIAKCFSATEILHSTNSYLTTADRLHLKKILEPGLTSNDIAFTYYAVQGYVLLGEVLPKKLVSNFAYPHPCNSQLYFNRCDENKGLIEIE